MKLVNIKSLEHRRYMSALIFLYKFLFITGPNYIKELFSLRSSNYDLRGYCQLNQPTFKSKYLHKSGFDKTLTPGQLTPYWPPLLTPYKINGKMKIKKPRTINGTRFKFISKFSLPETSKMAVVLQISDSLLIWLKDLSRKIEHRISWNISKHDICTR